MSSQLPESATNTVVHRLLREIDLVYAEHLLGDIIYHDPTQLSPVEQIQWRRWVRYQRGPGRRRQFVKRICWIGLSGCLLLTAILHLAASSTSALTIDLAQSIAALLLVIIVFIEMRQSADDGYQPWPARARLAGKSRRRIDLRPLRESLEQELGGRGIADDTRMFVAASIAVNDIHLSGAWRSGELDRMSVQVDLDLVLQTVARRAVEIRLLSSGSTVAGAIRTTRDTAAPHDRWCLAAGLLQALLNYRNQIRHLERASDSADHRGDIARAAAIDELGWSVIALAAMT